MDFQRASRTAFASRFRNSLRYTLAVGHFGPNVRSANASHFRNLAIGTS
jgi:hypothetical protein